MISKLSGILDTIAADSLIIDVQGVGYHVYASTKTLSSLPPPGEKIVLYIDHVFRQEHQQLCGFYDQKEKQWFHALLSVQGVGVRVALAILSVLTPDELAKAILMQDKTLLTRADGVGVKVASRIVLELKDKKLEMLSDTAIEPSQFSSPMQDTISALINLGYSKSEAATALSKIAQETSLEQPTAILIKLALQKLAIKRV